MRISCFVGMHNKGEGLVTSVLMKKYSVSSSVAILLVCMGGFDDVNLQEKNF